MTIVLTFSLGIAAAVAAPAPPTGLKSTPKTTSSYLSMSWNPVTGAVGYRLVYSTKADMSAPFYRNIASGTTGGYGGLPPATTYYVKIKALKPDGTDLTTYSAAVTAKTLPAQPAPPTGLKSTTQTTSSYLSMSWNPVTGAVGYRLVYSTKADMSAPFYRNIASGTTGGYGGLPPATTYYVKIKALKSDGTDLTTYSAAVTAKTLPAQPAPPTGLKSTTQTTSTYLSMTWNPVTAAVGYRLVYSTKADMSAPFYRNIASGTTGGYGGLPPATTYYVKIKALKSDGTDLTTYSAAVTAKTLPAQPAPPTGLTATAQATTTLTFSWNPVPNAPQYRLALSNKADMGSATYLSISTTSGEVRGLSPATKYYAQVRAIDVSGSAITAYSTIAQSATAALPVLPPIDKPLSVASYNIRCSSCNDGLPEEKPWAERRDFVVETIVSKMPDIIGVQEASQTWLDDPRPGGYTQFEDLRDRLSAAGTAYTLTDADRNNCVDSRLPTNCVYADKGASAGTKIFYNANTVKLIRSGSKLLPADPDANVPRYVAWAEAVQLSTGKHVFFADAHLEIGKDAASNDRRRLQAQAVMDTIKIKNTGSLPVVLVGDMNSSKWTEPANGPYDVYTSQGLFDPLGNTYGSWYPSGGATAENVVNRRVNSWNGFERVARQGADGTSGAYIDYIFTSKMRVPTYENVAKIDASGNYVGTIPSDHNMQIATVGLP